MSKTIVFCADGTWNGPEEPEENNDSAFPSNVFKLFSNLAGSEDAGSPPDASEQERSYTDESGTKVQIAKYIHGVGDSGNWLAQALGGSTGAGIITRIVRGYTFVSRNYVPNDKIFLSGFSRGAYTARALAGLIAAKGLLDASKLDLRDKENAYRLGAAVWYSYRRQAVRANSDMFGRLQELADDLPHFLSNPAIVTELREAPIEGVAVWDTVGALGIPEVSVSGARVDAFRFADTKLSPIVRHGIHAIAVDEQRGDFTPTLWDADPRIMQVLFPGAHADIGGGYPVAGRESGISDCALQWMTERLGELGVVFSPTPTHQPNPDPMGTSHKPWLDGAWKVLPHYTRAFPMGLRVTGCLLARIAAEAVCDEPGKAPTKYNPGNLVGYVADGRAAANVEPVCTRTSRCHCELAS